MSTSENTRGQLLRKLQESMDAAGTAPTSQAHLDAMQAIQAGEDAQGLAAMRRELGLPD